MNLFEIHSLKQSLDQVMRFRSFRETDKLSLITTNFFDFDLQYQALLDLYDATNGDSWYDNSNWKTSANLSDWYGLSVWNGEVYSIDLSYNNLDGTLPTSFGILNGLNYVYLHGNSISGSLPSSIGNLTQLYYLLLYWNELSGTIPSAIFSIETLFDLELDSNSFTSTIPREIGKCRSLVYLRLSSNLLTGSIPSSIGELSQLEYMILYSNKISGTIPSNVFSISTLYDLQLYSNSLTGTVPTQIGLCVSLGRIWFDDNILTGTIPSAIGSLTNLKLFNIPRNSLTGSIPESICNLVSLEYLVLPSNLLTGPMPRDIGNLSKLVILHLYRNSFSGTLASSLGNLVLVLDMSIEENRWTGTVPESIGFLSNLQELWLLQTSLSGTIPTSFGHLTSCSKLYFYQSAFSGPIPETIGSMSSLEYFELYSNSFTGSLPSTIGNLTKLSIFTAYENLLSGQIPNSFGKLTLLLRLYLYDNMITGSMPSQIGKMKSLTRMYLHQNLLTGSIPRSLSGLTKLRYFYAYDNNLYGTLPSNIGAMSAIEIYDISENSLSGTIPTSIGSLNKASTLNFANNLFSGSLPSSVGLLGTIKYVDVSHNMLTGTLPSSITAFSVLEQLLLNTNRISGRVPSFIVLMYKLAKLDLSNNIITNRIPTQLDNLKELNTVYLDNNYISGTLPNTPNSLTALRILSLENNLLTSTIPSTMATVLIYLNVAHNRITGSIPSLIGLMKDLEVLNVAYNSIAQTIPRFFGNLAALSELHLDHNSISGAIPETVTTLSSLTIMNLNDNRFTGVWTAAPPNLLYASIGGNKFAGDALAGFCSVDSLVSLNVTSLDNICNPWCFNESVLLGLSDDVSYCSSVVQQRQSLIDFYHATSGSNWVNAMNWNSSVPFKMWYGISVSGSDVSRIELTHNRLQGTIPESFSILSSLTTLILYDNNLMGTFPLAFFALSKLIVLSLYSNDFTGDIINIPPNLQYMDIGDNYFTGNALSAVCDFTSILRVNITDMNEICDPWCFDDGVLVGKGQSVAYCTSVVNQRNGLFDFFQETYFVITQSPTISPYPTLFPTPVPSLSESSVNELQYCEPFSTEETYDGTENVVKCTIMACGGSRLIASTCDDYSDDWRFSYDFVSDSCTGDTLLRLFFRGVEVANNDDSCWLCSKIDYSIPGSVDDCEIYSLHQGCYDRESCSGRVSVSGGSVVTAPTHFPTQIPTFAPTVPQLSWKISTNWGSSKPLKDWYGVTTKGSDVYQLRLSSNQIIGTISNSLSVLTAMRDLSLDKNSFSGTIPSALGYLTALSSLDLQFNRLTGTVPENFVQLSGIRRLVLSHNELLENTMSLFPKIARMANLELFDIGYNSFSGLMPSYVGSLFKLSLIDVSYNFLSGTAPGTIIQLKDLEYLYFAGNLLSKAITDNLCRVPNLKIVNIGGMNVCYPICLQQQVYNSYNGHGAVRCQDDNDKAFCDILSATNIASIIPNSITVETLTYESEHPVKDSLPAIEQSVSILGAASYVLEFDQWTDISFEYLRLCADSTCAETFYELYASSPTDTLSGLTFTISSASFVFVLQPLYRSYGACPRAKNRYKCFGYLLKISANIKSVGWEGCTTPPPNSLFSVSVNNKRPTLLSFDNSYAGDYCTWEGVVCDTFTSKILSLDLSAWGLEGTIPTSIGYLTDLEYLSLANNKLHGTIPSELGNLVNLRSLDLQRNILSGTVPTNLGSLAYFNNSSSGDSSSVNQLDLSFNELTGTLNDIYCDLLVEGSVFDISSNKIDCYHPCWDAIGENISFVRDDIQACAPTSMPTSVPLVSKNNNQRLLPVWAIIIICCISVPAILATFALLFQEVISHHVARIRDFRKLPIHRAIVFHMNKQDILDSIENHPNTAGIKDVNGMRAIDHALQTGVDNDVLYEIVKTCLPYHIETGDEIPESFHAYTWVDIVQADEGAPIIDKILRSYPKIANKLIYAEDIRGRSAINVANQTCKKVILGFLYFVKRYEILTVDSPHHSSDSCIIHIAIDHDSSDERVALKFMKKKANFQKELYMREHAELDAKYVVNILKSIDVNEDEDAKLDVERMGFHEYPFCLVMPAGDRDLRSILSNEGVTDEKERIRSIIYDVANAIEHLHGRGIIHGDIRPANIIRIGHRMKLTDLDGSVFIGKDYAGHKLNSGYVPPELVLCVNDEYCVRKCEIDSTIGRVDSQIYDYDLIRADPSQDVWAFGAVLYELWTGVKLFLTDKNDCIVDESSFKQLYEFTDDFKRDYLLSRIDNLKVKNLISQVLTKDPNRRPTISQILQHPFLSGQLFTRKASDEAQFDVYISYRPESDSHHAEMLYDELVQAGFRVWLDQKSVTVGAAWETRFDEGLMKSRIFMPILSREAINHPINPAQRFAALHQHSPCDDLLLEFWSALELRERGLIEKIYPVMIGDATVQSIDGDESVVYGNYFDDDCHPRLTGGDLIVSSVQRRLERHFNNLAMGSLILENFSVMMILSEMVRNHGLLIQGPQSSAFICLIDDVTQMIVEDSNRSHKQSFLDLLQSNVAVQPHGLKHRRQKRFSDSVLEVCREFIASNANAKMYPSQKSVTTNDEVITTTIPEERSNFSRPPSRVKSNSLNIYDIATEMLDDYQKVPQFDVEEVIAKSKIIRARQSTIGGRSRPVSAEYIEQKLSRDGHDFSVNNNSFKYERIYFPSTRSFASLSSDSDIGYKEDNSHR